MLHRRSFLNLTAATAVAASLPKVALGATQAPFKMYDTHTHFYTPDQKHFPFRPDLNTISKLWVKKYPTTPEVIFKAWDAAGVEMGCGVQYNTTYYTDNRYLLDVAAHYPKRVVPIVILDPLKADTPATLARMASENHIAGVRFSGVPDASGKFAFLEDRANDAWAAANDLGLVVVLMPQKSDQPDALPNAMAKIAQHADKYPRVNIVIDHIGFPEAVAAPTFGFSPQHLALAAHKNVYYKFTTYLIEGLQEGNVPTRPFLDYAVSVFKTDHMVWGSDVGNSDGTYPEFVKYALDAAAGLSLAQKHALFYDTAKGLFIPGGRGRA